jgi:hypothetical protein
MEDHLQQVLAFAKQPALQASCCYRPACPVIGRQTAYQRRPFDHGTMLPPLEHPEKNTRIRIEWSVMI